jgi:D-alanyl-lipoteichoic acid acyltransferase DltB (MBOAT superfamily)
MSVASLPFLGFTAAVAMAFHLSKAQAWRQAVLLAGSLCFLATYSPKITAYGPLAAFLALGYAGVRLMQGHHRRWTFPALVVGTIFVFAWFKKYSFLPSSIFLSFAYTTIGLSYVFFRVLHLIIDAKGGDLPDRVGLAPYLNYTLNFTTLVSGPIQRYQDFARMTADPGTLTPRVAACGIERIIKGFFKVNVLSLLLSMLHAHEVAALSASQGFAERVVTAALVAVSYSFYLYHNFSGSMDIVVGVARFFALELPENFDRPFSADNFLNFWSRWHITLSTWLKTYVYNPLLGALMRRFDSRALEPFLGVVAFFVTFFLVGIWHGQTSVFIVFGMLQGLGVSVNKLYQILMTRALGRKEYRALSARPFYVSCTRGLTFTWFTLSLVWFWSNWGQMREMVGLLRVTGVVITLACVFLGGTVVLSLWEFVRAKALSVSWNGSPLLLSPYLRTVWNTALTFSSLALVLLTNAPAPDLVYKGF